MASLEQLQQAGMNKLRPLVKRAGFDPNSVLVDGTTIVNGTHLVVRTVERDDQGKVVMQRDGITLKTRTHRINLSDID